MDELVSISKAAERLGGISHWTVRSWIAQGRLTTVKLGARRLIPVSELSRLVLEGIEEAKRPEKPWK
ncbi:MAG: DNA-binding protein [Acidobacteria bacterium]|nr:DNA-binding protein [Acidobacteriota bacterium]